jgi:NTP pyrophosphatase (non-canonical NTP hydrolase)
MDRSPDSLGSAIKPEGSRAGVFEISIDHYQQESVKTAIYPRHTQTIYPLLGLIGETSELIDKMMNTVHSKSEMDVPVLIALENAETLMRDLELYKKAIRDRGRQCNIVLEMSDDQKLEIVKELGDILWYLSTLANDLGFRMSEVARINLEKLKSRRNKGTISGAGDNR